MDATSLCRDSTVVHAHIRSKQANSEIAGIATVTALTTKLNAVPSIVEAWLPRADFRNGHSMSIATPQGIQTRRQCLRAPRRETFRESTWQLFFPQSRIRSPCPKYRLRSREWVHHRTAEEKR